MNSLHGILDLDKPAGVTSAGALNRVKRLLPRGTKLGHAGTLDPFATGVLLLLVGKATKRCEALMGSPKTYDATIKLGATTTTDDLESPEEAYRSATSARVPKREEVESALQGFVGAIEQRPPLYSALKIDGKRACDRVRAGEVVEVRPRIVQVYSINLLRYEFPLVEVRI